MTRQSTKNKSAVEVEAQAPPAKPEPLTITLGEAAILLGVHRSTVWNLQKRGEFPIPVLRIGTSLRVHKGQLMKFIETGEPIAPGESSSSVAS